MKNVGGGWARTIERPVYSARVRMILIDRRTRAFVSVAEYQWAAR